MLRQVFHELTVRTRGRGLYEFTNAVEAWVSEQHLQNGLLTLLLRHTSASLLIQENADPDVRRDLEAFFTRLVPDGDPLFVHTIEGEDDMPAHIRAALTAANLSLPVKGGQLTLGTWQGLYLWEHRRIPHTRTVCLQFVGEINGVAEAIRRDAELDSDPSQAMTLRDMDSHMQQRRKP